MRTRIGVLCFLISLLFAGCQTDTAPEQQKRPPKEPLWNTEEDAHASAYAPQTVSALPEGFVLFSEVDCGTVLHYSLLETHIWAFDTEYKEISSWPLSDTRSMITYQGNWYISEDLHQQLLAAAQNRYAVLNRAYRIGETISLRSEYCRYSAVVTGAEGELVYIELTDERTNTQMQPTYSPEAFVYQAITSHGQVITDFGWDTPGAVRVALQPGDSVSQLVFCIPGTEETRCVLLT